MKRLGLYRLFMEKDKGEWLRIVAAAVVAGAMQGLVVLVINQAAARIDGNLQLRLLLLFLTTAGLYGLASHYSTSRTIALTERIIFARYVAIADKIRNAGTREYEAIGRQTVYSTLETNTDIILETSKNLAAIGAAVVMILFCAVYIGSLSMLALVTVIAFYMFGIFVYKENLKSAQAILGETVESETLFRRLFRHFVEGFKELKVNTRKSDDIFENHVRPVSEKAKGLRIRAERSLTVNTAFIQAFYYTIIAAMIFLLPRISHLESLTIVKIAAIVLFSYGSMTRIVNSIPLLLKSERAIAGLDDLDRKLEEARDPVDAPSNRFAALAPEEGTIRLRDVRFTYPSSDNLSHFTLGPVSLTVRPGNILFLVGGNGSGKTTLLKILAGLYHPREGTLSLGGTPIDRQGLADYRNRLSVIFPDYYLFDRFYGMEEVDQDRLDAALETLGLAGHVRFRNGTFGDFHLSAGLSKRMALLMSHMEGRPVLVIDEVAADLDPAFRKFFYESYLPSLRESGMTIIAVSHDEQYFHTADHLVKLENGRIVSDTATSS